MKKLIFIVCLSYAVLAHAGNSVNNGGNAILEDSDDKATLEEVQGIVSMSRKDLFQYLLEEFKAYKWGANSSPSFKKLFSAEPSIFEILKEVALEVKMTGPCFDEKGEMSDGSSIGINPQSICVSVPRLQERVRKTEMWFQSLALTAHEFSHRAGFNEIEAGELQKEIYKRFKKYAHNYQERPSHYQHGQNCIPMADFVYEIQEQMKAKPFRDEMPYLGLSEDSIESYKLSEALSRISSHYFFSCSNSDIMNDKEKFIMNAYSWKATALIAGIKTLIKSSKDSLNGTLDGYDLLRAHYHHLFGKRTRITLDEYISRYRNPYLPPEYEKDVIFPFEIRRIKSQQDIQHELMEIAVGAKWLRERMIFLTTPD